MLPAEVRARHGSDEGTVLIAVETQLQPGALCSAVNGDEVVQTLIATPSARHCTASTKQVTVDALERGERFYRHLLLNA